MKDERKYTRRSTLYVDSMTMYTGDNGIFNKIFITVRHSSITFSRQASAAIGDPAYVHMYFSEKKKIIAFVPCEKDRSAISFFKEPKKDRAVLVRIFGQDKVSIVSNISGMSFSKKGIKFVGKAIPSENTIVFDLSKKM